MRVKYTYDESEGILYAAPPTPTTIDLIVEHYLYLKNFKDLSPSLRILIDCRNVQFRILPDEISETEEAVAEALQHFKDLKEAILVEQPFEVVVATLFQQYNERQTAYEFNIFSTLKEAKRWLKK